MTRSYSFLPFAFAVTLLAATGCNKDEKAGPGGMQAYPQDMPVDQPGPSGVALCDAYMELSEKCVSEKVPENERAGLMGIIRTMRNNYKRSASSPEGKSQLNDTCKRDLEHSKMAMARFGCNWNSDALTKAAAGEPAAGGAVAADAGAPATDAAADAAPPAAEDAGAAAKKPAKKSKARPAK
ncbi:MAG TPA: hypothetical protein VK524_13795 [Polyangiaceae bacterium]|nr:hypothetical protein [Polyangiaceae bacterium]